MSSNQQHRGERLHPSRFHSRYAILTALTEEMQRMANVLQSAGSSRRLDILDFGCGNMPYKPLFDSFANYRGADLVENDLAEIEIHDGIIHLPDESCDVVVSTQVLEHVQDPSKYLNEAHRVLRQGGKLILTTHGYWLYHPDPNDYWRWTKEGLKLIVEQSQLSVRELAPMVGLAGAGLHLFQDGIDPYIPKLLRPLFYFFIQHSIKFVNRYMKRSRGQDALCFLIVAEKSI